MPRDKSERNGAAARYLRTAQANTLPKITYKQIAESSGIPFETVKRLMTNKADLTMDSFSDIANSLGVDAADALVAFAEIIRKERF